MAETGTGEVRLRWTWGYDGNGRRVTEAECIGYRECGDCHGVHPVTSVLLLPLPGRLVSDVVGTTTSEFFPDDE